MYSRWEFHYDVQYASKYTVLKLTGILLIPLSIHVKAPCMTDAVNQLILQDKIPGHPSTKNFIGVGLFGYSGQYDTPLITHTPAFVCL
jgi:hypothetical protein